MFDMEGLGGGGGEEKEEIPLFSNLPHAKTCNVENDVYSSHGTGQSTVHRQIRDLERKKRIKRQVPQLL